MLRLGMTSVTFRQLTIDEVASIVEEAGLSYIEWGGDVHVKPGDLASATAAVDAMKKHGLLCSAYGSYYRVGDDDMAEFELICKTAHALGAPKIRVWLGRCGSAETSAEMLEKYVIEVRKMADIAKKYGRFVAFEFHGKTYNDNGASCVGFLQKVGRENVKTYWQPLSFGNSEENLSLVARDVLTVHVFNWNDKNERFPLSDGAEKWKRYISIIKSAGISCDFTMEFVKDDKKEQFLADAKTLIELVN